MEFPATDKTSPGLRLISTRMVVGLGLGAGVQALLICWAVLGPWPALEMSKVLGPSSAPGTLVGFALAWSAVLAPLWFARTAEADPWNPIYRSMFLGGWQGAALGFFLLVASRVVPLDLSGSLQALLVVSISTIFFVLLAAKGEQLYLGLAFFLLAALPMGAYLLAEVFLATPAGAMGFGKGATQEALRLRTIINLMLSFSPCTAAIGALHGKLVNGTPWGWVQTTLYAGVGSIICLGLGWSNFGKTTESSL